MKKITCITSLGIALALPSSYTLFAQSDHKSQEQNSSIIQISQEYSNIGTYAENGKHGEEISFQTDIAPEMQMDPMRLDELNSLVDWFIGIRPVSVEVEQIVREAGLEEDLQAAEQIKAEAISGKEAAVTSFISDATEATLGKKTINDRMAEGFANKLEAARLNCKEQAAIFFKKAEEVRQNDASESVALTHLAQTYETAAEQVWLAKKVWRAMANKKAIKLNKTSLLGVDPAEKAKKDAARAVLEQTVEFANLPPSLRSAELFKNADAAWNRTKEAWNERMSVQQQHETKDALLEKAKEVFESEKIGRVEKTSIKHKTFLGKCAHSASNALQNVSLLGIAPAFIPSVFSMSANVANERALKKEFKKAHKNLKTSAQEKEANGKTVQDSEEGAPHTEINAEDKERYARNYYKKVARLAARNTTELTWEKRVKVSEQALKTLEAEGMTTINSIKADFDLFAQKAKNARAKANDAKTNLKEAQDRLEAAKEELAKWTTESAYNKSLAISDPDAKMRLENEFIEARKNLNQCYESNNPNNSPEVNALEKIATAAEEEAISHLQAYLDQRDHLLRGIDRARFCLAADKAAWIAFWPEEALRKIDKEEESKIKMEESVPSSSSLLSFNSSVIPSNINNMLFNVNKEMNLVLTLQQARQALEKITTSICNYTPEQGVITIDKNELDYLNNMLCNNHKLEALSRITMQTEDGKRRALAKLGIGSQEIVPEYVDDQSASEFSNRMRVQLDKITGIRGNLEVLKISEDTIDRAMAPLMQRNPKLRAVRNNDKAKKSENLRKNLQKELENVKQRIEELCQWDCYTNEYTTVWSSIDAKKQEQAEKSAVFTKNFNDQWTKNTQFSEKLKTQKNTELKTVENTQTRLEIVNDADTNESARQDANAIRMANSKAMEAFEANTKAMEALGAARKISLEAAEAAKKTEEARAEADKVLTAYLKLSMNRDLQNEESVSGKESQAAEEKEEILKDSSI